MYKKIVFSLLFFPLCAFSCFGKKQNIVDSLLNELSHIKADTIKSQILANLAFEYANYDINKAIAYGNMGLEFAKEINYTHGVALSLQSISYIHYLKSDYATSLKYALEAIKEAQKINQFVILSISYGIVGNIYSAQKENKQALKYYQQALQTGQEAKDSGAITVALNRLGKVYLDQGDYTQAITFLNQAYALANQMKSIDKQSDCLFYLGKAYLMKKEYPKALLYFHQSLRLDKKVGDKTAITMSYKEIAKVHYKSKQLDSTITYCKYALAEISPINSKQETLEINEVLYLTYKERKQTQNALYYHEQMMLLKDSIYSKEKINAMTDLQANFEIKQKQTEIEKQNIQLQLRQKTIEERSIVRNFFIVGFIVATFLGYMFYNNYQKIKKANLLTASQNKLIKEQSESLQAINEELNQQNEEITLLNGNLEKMVVKRTQELKLTIEDLSKQNQDLEQFSYIISHNLRAPVARILGLINIYDSKEVISPANQQVLTYLQEATKNLDEVIKDLTKIIAIRKNLTSIKEPINLKHKLDTILSYFDNQIKEHNIQIEYNLQEINLHSIKSYIQSILFNLISNAIKYKSNKRTPVISISTQIENNFVCIAVKDNGIGIDLTNVDTYKIFGLYQRMHDHVEGKGLGLYLVKTQVEFLNGTVTVKSQLDVGTTFKVYIPLHA
jgi:signal transduction histidine kinase